MREYYTGKRQPRDLSKALTSESFLSAERRIRGEAIALAGKHLPKIRRWIVEGKHPERWHFGPYVKMVDFDNLTASCELHEIRRIYWKRLKTIWAKNWKHLTTNEHANIIEGIVPTLPSAFINPSPRLVDTRLLSSKTE